MLAVTMADERIKMACLAMREGRPDECGGQHEDGMVVTTSEASALNSTDSLSCGKHEPNSRDGMRHDLIGQNTDTAGARRYASGCDCCCCCCCTQLLISALNEYSHLIPHHLLPELPPWLLLHRHNPRQHNWIAT
mmetsp:Transcript_21812/g.60715  ORF Transcript_21812/g.60715 Transcript_21812/m.60715 type:complete len:135 (+) Transcript_21812:188-592(+)